MSLVLKMKKTTAQRFIFGGILLIVWTSILFYNETIFYTAAIEVPGTIIYDEENRRTDVSSKVVTFSYTTVDGIRHTKGPQEVPSNLYHLELNDPIRVFYTPNDPENARIYNYNPILSIIVIIIGIYFVSIGIINILFNSNNSNPEVR